MPKRGVLEISNEITREFSPHVTPEKEQCIEEDFPASFFQSSRPEPVGPSMEDFMIKRVSRSVNAWTEKRREIRAKNSM